MTRWPRRCLPDELGSDEAGATGDKDGHQALFFCGPWFCRGGSGISGAARRIGSAAAHQPGAARNPGHVSQHLIEQRRLARIHLRRRRLLIAGNRDRCGRCGTGLWPARRSAAKPPRGSSRACTSRKNRRCRRPAWLARMKSLLVMPAPFADRQPARRRNGMRCVRLGDKPARFLETDVLTDAQLAARCFKNVADADGPLRIRASSAHAAYSFSASTSSKARSPSASHSPRRKHAAPSGTADGAHPSSDECGRQA